MTLYRLKSFSVPASEKQSKTPCAIHHFVKGKCLRCPEKIVTKSREDEDATARLEAAAAHLPPDDTHSMPDAEARLMVWSPTKTPSVAVRPEDEGLVEGRE